MACAAFLIAASGATSARASDVIYANAPLSTGPQTELGEPAPDGSTWSELQHDQGNYFETNNILGASASYLTPFSGFRLADDFVVPEGEQWAIDSVTLYSYVTDWFWPDESPFSAYFVRIWNGRPGDAGNSVIFGDTTTDRMLSSTFSSIYRIGNTVVPEPAAAKENRLVWQNEVALGLTLGPGRYWIEWQSAANGNSTHWDPAATVPLCRTLPGFNARQFRVSTGGWSDVLADGYPTSAHDVALDFPFVLHGSNSSDCAADFDKDGFLTGLDFDAFVHAFEQGDARADFDKDGFVTGLDFDEFVYAFEAGCG